MSVVLRLQSSTLSYVQDDNVILSSHRDLYFSLQSLLYNVWVFSFYLSISMCFCVSFTYQHYFWEVVGAQYVFLDGIYCYENLLHPCHFISLSLCFKYNQECINFRDNSVVRRCVTHHRAELLGKNDPQIRAR